MRTLTDRVAVVTGAASGIGRATALALADAGAHLALVDLDEAGLAAVAESVRSRGRKASLHGCDVADRAALTALPDAVMAEHGAVHVLVNNAGVTVGKTFEDHTLEDLDWILGIDLEAVLVGCHAFLPHLRRADEAHIVNLSSMAAFVGLPLQTTYCAAKFAVRGFSEGLRAELADSPIGVTSIHPGATRTAILEHARHADPEHGARMAALLARRGPPPERVARAIVRAIRKNRRRAVVGLDSRATEVLARLCPGLLLWGLGLAWRRGWGRPGGPGSVTEPAAR